MMSNNVYHTYVPNEGPKDAKIVFVGEAPGADEEYNKRPFVGRAGDKLTTVLGRNGILRSQVRLSNLAHYRPFGNKFENLLDTDELREGWAELQKELLEIKPNVIVALGNWPLFFLTGKYGKKPGTGIMHWRGSILNCQIQGLGETKVVPTYHPSFINYKPKAYSTFDLDIKRVAKEARTKKLTLPQRKLVINPSDDELELYVEEILRNAEWLSTDIETYGPKLACVGFSHKPSFGLCIPYDYSNRKAAIERLLRSDIPKVTHFGYFDRIYLTDMGLPFNNWAWDTYVAQHVEYAELPNTLAYLTSIYTEEPYYKSEGREVLADQKSWTEKSVNKDALYRYNCKDVCTTGEIFIDQKIEIASKPAWQKFLDFEMELSRGAMFHLSKIGMNVDIERRALFKLSVLKEWVAAQIDLNAMAGRAYVKKPIKIPGTDVPQLVNVGSSKQVIAFLYGELGVKVRRNKEGAPTVEEDALVSIIAEAKKEYEIRVKEETKKKWLRILISAKTILIIRGKRKLLSSYINPDTSKDGKYRSIYKVGPITGRMAADKYHDKTGINMMTNPRGVIKVDEKYIPFRTMYVASKGYLLVEMDFSQAESWVVAYLANEPTMKKALKLGVLHETTASSIFGIPIREVTKIQRFLGKKGNHQLGYGSTHLKLAQSINAESDQPPFITVTIPESRVIHDRWHDLYLIEAWWEDVREGLTKTNNIITTVYGREIVLFGQWGKELWKQAYSINPQSTVADHTNGAIHPELGIKGGLIEVYKQFVIPEIIRVVNQSHDSIIMEMKIEEISDIIPQVYKLMHRPLIAKGNQFTIPVDVKVGERWYEMEEYSLRT